MKTLPITAAICPAAPLASIADHHEKAKDGGEFSEPSK